MAYEWLTGGPSTFDAIMAVVLAGAVLLAVYLFVAVRRLRALEADATSDEGGVESVSVRLVRALRDELSERSRGDIPDDEVS